MVPLMLPSTVKLPFTVKEPLTWSEPVTTPLSMIIVKVLFVINIWILKTKRAYIASTL